MRLAVFVILFFGYLISTMVVYLKNERQPFVLLQCLNQMKRLAARGQSPIDFDFAKSYREENFVPNKAGNLPKSSRAIRRPIAIFSLSKNGVFAGEVCRQFFLLDYAAIVYEAQNYGHIVPEVLRGIALNLTSNVFEGALEFDFFGAGKIA